MPPFNPWILLFSFVLASGNSAALLWLVPANYRMVSGKLALAGIALSLLIGIIGFTECFRVAGSATDQILMAILVEIVVFICAMIMGIPLWVLSRWLEKGQFIAALPPLIGVITVMIYLGLMGKPLVFPT